MPISPSNDLQLVVTGQKKKISGLLYPMDVSGVGGYFTRAEGKQLIRQSIVNIVMTLPGERPMMPSFGSNLKRLAFSPNDSITRQQITEEITTAIEKYEPRVTNVSVVASSLDNNTLKVVLSYRIRSDYDKIETLELLFDV